MPYPKVNWQNGEAGGTPLNAENLNIMDNAIKANEDAIIQNTADIEELKNKPTTALILASASPLPNTTASNILGIDVSGKSEQAAQNLAIFNTNGFINSSGTLDTSNTATVCSEYVAVEVGKTYTFATNSQMNAICISTFNASKAIVARNFQNNAKEYSYTIPSGVSFVRVHFQMASAIAWQTAVATYEPQFVEGYPYPTPTNPIPIVDASGEIVAKTKNLFNPSNVLNAHINDASGIKSSNDARLVYAECKPNKTYTVSKASGQRFQVAYTSELPQNGVAYYGKINNATASTISITVGADARYVVAFVWLSSADTSISASDMVASVQIEEGTTATDYVEYQSNSITLPITLRSVGTVADTLVINKDGSGKHTQKFKSVTFRGGWNMASTTGVFYIDNSAPDGNIGDVLCNYGLLGSYYLGSAGEAIRYPNKICIQALNGLRFVIYAPDFTTADAFNEQLSHQPMTVYYPLKKANVIETDLTAEQVSAILALKTYNGTTIIDSELDVNSVSYSADVKGYVEEASASMALNSMKVTRNIPSLEAGEMIYTIATPTGFPYSENIKYKAYIVQAGAFVPFKLNSVTCTSTYISVSVTFPDGVSGAGTLELLLYWDEYKPIDVAPVAMVMSVDEGGIAE